MTHTLRRRGRRVSAGGRGGGRSAAPVCPHPRQRLARQPRALEEAHGVCAGDAPVVVCGPRRNGAGAVKQGQGKLPSRRAPESAMLNHDLYAFSSTSTASSPMAADTGARCAARGADVDVGRREGRTRHTLSLRDTREACDRKAALLASSARAVVHRLRLSLAHPRAARRRAARAAHAQPCRRWLQLEPTTSIIPQTGRPRAAA